MKTKVKLKYLVFIYSLFLISPIADAITGYLLHTNFVTEGGLYSPSQFLRFILFLYSLLLLNKKQIQVTCFIYLYLFCLDLLSITRHGQFSGIIWGQLFILKIISLFTFFFALYNLWAKYKQAIIKLFIQSAILYGTILIITAALGIGVSTYAANTFGFKGIFASGNAMGLYLGCTLCLITYIKFKYPIILSRNIFFYEIILFIGTLLIATKTSFIFIIIFLIIKFLKLELKNKLIAIFALGTVLFLWLPSLLNNLSIIYEVVLFRFNRTDLLSFIFSARDGFVRDAFDEFYKTDYYIRFFTGGGGVLSFQQPADILLYDTLETDLFDLFFMYGIFVVLSYINIIIFLLYKSFKNKILFIISLAVSIHSIMSGHIIFNAMSGSILIVLMLLALDKNEKNSMLPSL